MRNNVLLYVLYSTMAHTDTHTMTQVAWFNQYSESIVSYIF